MLGLIFILTIGMCIMGVIAITTNDDTSIFWMIIALAIAVFLGMQIEQYKQFEKERLEQLISK